MQVEQPLEMQNYRPNSGLIEEGSFKQQTDMPLKQQEKSRFFSSTKIAVIAVIVLVGLLMTFSLVSSMGSQKTEAQNLKSDRITQMASSSSGKDTSSNSGSVSSGKSKPNSAKPIGISKTISKSNFGGFNGGDGGDDEDSENNPNRNSYKKTMSDGATTDDDSDSENSEDSRAGSAHGMTEIRREGEIPNVGIVKN